MEESKKGFFSGIAEVFKKMFGTEEIEDKELQIALDEISGYETPRLKKLESLVSDTESKSGQINKFKAGLTAKPIGGNSKSQDNVVDRSNNEKSREE